MTNLSVSDSAHVDEPPVRPLTWVVLSDGRQSPNAREPVPLRRMVVMTVAAAILVAAVVGFVGALMARHTAESEAVHDVAKLTDVIATSAVQPDLTDAMATSPRRATIVLDPLIRDHVIDRSLVRVKLWNTAGRVLYSDDPRLIGARFPLDSDATEALRTPQTQAEISDLTKPENRLDRGKGTLLEVYRPVWTPNGTPLLLETYFTYDSVNARSHDMWRGFAGIILASIALLMALLAPLVWALLARIRRARADRERAAAWALDVSEQERRHLAAALHDGVVQQLAATAFAVAAESQRAARSGDRALASRLGELAGGVRDAIAGLRSLLVDIYPPSLQTSGLAAALDDLARGAGADGADVEVRVDAAAADAITGEARRSTFRVVQEALRNAVRHSGAGHVLVSVRGGSGTAVVTVDDNGRGFEMDPRTRSGLTDHFGLRLMADAAASCDARLEIASAPGAGTHLRMSWPPRSATR